jgi:hypothetical protein
MSNQSVDPRNNVELLHPGSGLVETHPLVTVMYDFNFVPLLLPPFFQLTPERSVCFPNAQFCALEEETRCRLNRKNEYSISNRLLNYSMPLRQSKDPKRKRTNPSETHGHTRNCSEIERKSLERGKVEALKFFLLLSGKLEVFFTYIIY